MTYYVEAYERVKVLKQEYDMALEKWLSVCDSSTDRKEILMSFRDAKDALGKLDGANWELARIVSEMPRSQMISW